MKRTSSYMVAAACLALAGAVSLSQAESQAAPSSAASAALDYGFFKTKVEPVFLTKRPGHTRCVACHTSNNAPFHLVRLSPGSTNWNEEQSRQNFQLIQRVARSPSRWGSAIRVAAGSGVADIESLCAGTESVK